MGAAWLSYFLVELQRRGLKSSTLRTKQIILKDVLKGIELESCDYDSLMNHLDYYREKCKLNYYRMILVQVKQALKFLDRKDVADRIVIPKAPRRDGLVASRTLTSVEIEKIISEAPTFRDRLLLSLLYESGARRGEVVGLRIKDVQFDEHGALVCFSGKTGTRRRRLYSCVPDLKRWLNDHPKRNDPDATLFLNDRGEALRDHAFYHRIKILGRKILRREISPHWFRHTKATEDSKYFTDREMKLLFGWSKTESIDVYSHLSMRDVDDKDLVLHGKKRKEEVLRPVVDVQRCSSCYEENAPYAMFCVKCGVVLMSQLTLRQLENPEFLQKMMASKPFKKALSRLFQGSARA